MVKNFQINNQSNQNKYKKYAIGLGILAAILIATNAMTAYFWQKASRLTSDVNQFKTLIVDN